MRGSVVFEPWTNAQRSMSEKGPTHPPTTIRGIHMEDISTLDEIAIEYNRSRNWVIQLAIRAMAQSWRDNHA